MVTEVLHLDSKSSANTLVGMSNDFVLLIEFKSIRSILDRYSINHGSYMIVEFDGNVWTTLVLNRFKVLLRELGKRVQHWLDDKRAVSLITASSTENTYFKPPL